MIIYNHIVIGLGEVGQPLLNILRRKYPHSAGHDPAKGKDLLISPTSCRILNICMPGNDNFFIQTAESYIDSFDPQAVCIHSSVPPGTTDTIQKHTSRMIVHSPVIGKHERMEEKMLSYPKMIGTDNSSYYEYFRRELSACGFQCVHVPDSKATELGKLLQTSLYGLLIAWAQETSRLSKRHGTEYDLVKRFWTEFESDDFDPKTKWPGIIGGHCVIPNIEVLQQIHPSHLLEAILQSNNYLLDRKSL